MKRAVVLVLVLVLVLVVTALLSFTVSAKTSSRLITGAEIPEFELVGSSIIKIGPGELYFQATVINNGTPAAAGTVQTSQEDVIYQMEVPFGSGTLDESKIGMEGMDLNGDGDRIDTFDFQRAPTATREWDIDIYNGTTYIHVYAIEEPITIPVPDRIRNYTVNGQSKVFQLGSENHSIYFAIVEGFVQFGLGNVVVLDHPSPCFMLALSCTEFDAPSRKLAGNLTAEDLKINGKPAEINLSKSLINYDLGLDPYMTKLFIISSPGLEIATGELVTFSGTLKASSNATFDADLLMNWSPDGIQRYMYDLGGVNGYTIVVPGVNKPDTTTDGIPGFTFLPTVTLAVIIILTARRRKRD